MTLCIRPQTEPLVENVPLKTAADTLYADAGHAASYQKHGVAAK